jgi:peptide/nickel transport system ATP-binding protein
MWVLKAEQVKSSYVLDIFGVRKIIQAVNQVNLEVRENEVYGIAGESGCGKTTLLRTVYGDIEPPLRLIGGRVWYQVDGEEVDLFSLRPEERRRLRWSFISFVSQSSMSVLNPVVKIKGSFTDFSGGGKKKDEVLELARRHLTELGLPPKVLEAYPHQLSGGMRQRVVIALASFLSPRVLIADEPVTALDVVVQRGVLQLLKEVQEKLEATLILVTHDMGVLANIADRIGIVYAGKMIEEARVETIFEEPLHPYTRYLINSLPQFGDKGMRESAPGVPPSLVDLPTGCAFHPRCRFAMEICRQEVPECQGVGDQHRVACWLMQEGRDKQDS